jgi:streptomycin 6-kinase
MGGAPEMELPEGLDWLRESETGREWRARLPGLVAECAEQWSLEVEAPYGYAYASLALPVTRADGGEAVLKVQFPGPECEHEAAALARWDGDGAVRLLEHDPERWALLIERCAPGTALGEAGPETALGVLIDLLPRLWKPAGAPFGLLAGEATRWRERLPGDYARAGEPFERELLDAALEALTVLPDSQGQLVLIHQDLHGANVLAAAREPWLAIDPKPLAGEREFGLAPIIRSHELGRGEEAAIGRLDRLCAELGLDRERARGWALGQTLAWAFDGERALPGHVETARWLAG